MGLESDDICPGQGRLGWTLSIAYGCCKVMQSSMAKSVLSPTFGAKVSELTVAWRKGQPSNKISFVSLSTESLTLCITAVRQKSGFGYPRAQCGGLWTGWAVQSKWCTRVCKWRITLAPSTAEH